MPQRNVQPGLPQVAPQLGVLTAEPRDRFVGLAALAGADRELGAKLLNRCADIEMQRRLRLSCLIEAQ
jgi:hypothetical protein